MNSKQQVKRDEAAALIQRMYNRIDSKLEANGLSEDSILAYKAGYMYSLLAHLMSSMSDKQYKEVYEHIRRAHVDIDVD